MNGARQSPRVFHQNLTQALTSERLGLVQAAHDPCMFTHRNSTGELQASPVPLSGTRPPPRDLRAPASLRPREIAPNANARRFHPPKSDFGAREGGRSTGFPRVDPNGGLGAVQVPPTPPNKMLTRDTLPRVELASTCHGSAPVDPRNERSDPPILPEDPNSSVWQMQMHRAALLNLSLESGLESVIDL